MHRIGVAHAEGAKVYSAEGRVPIMGGADTGGEEHLPQMRPDAVHQAGAFISGDAEAEHGGCCCEGADQERVEARGAPEDYGRTNSRDQAAAAGGGVGNKDRQGVWVMSHAGIPDRFEETEDQAL